MRCEDTRDKLADCLDDLLTADETAEVDTHVSACAVCTEALRELSELRDALYRPDPVAPSPKLETRILAAARAKPRSRLPVLVRYAAVFLAGVGVTLLFRPGAEIVEVPVERAVARAHESIDAPVAEVSKPRVPRRIR